MSKNYSQLRLGSIGRSAGRVAWMLASVVILYGSAVFEARAQQITVGISTMNVRGFNEPGVLVTIGSYSVTTDHKGNALLDIPLGTYQAKANTPCRVSQVIVAGNILKTGLESEPTLTFQVPKKGGYAVGFNIDCSTPATAGTVKVKIATTASCSDNANEAFKIQAGVSISIGGKSYTSNEKGVIEIDLPPGKYPISAAWHDYGLGFVKQNGIKIKTDEVGTPVVTLGDKIETLEVRMFTCGADGREKVRAVITEMGTVLDGSPNIRVIRSQAQGRGFVGMQLRDGDTVKISGKAKLKWLDGKGVISFEQSATIVISPDAPSGRQAPPSRGVVEVLQGVGSFFFPKEEHDYDEQGNIIKFKASSNSIALGVKGTKFSFGHDEQTHTSTIVVEEGVVEITPKYPGQRPFELNAGQRAEVSPAGVKGPTGSNAEVATADPVVKTSKSVYSPNERIDVEWSNPAGHPFDWVALARPNEGGQTSIGADLGGRWSTQIAGRRSGPTSFDGLPEGAYEARYISWANGNHPVTARMSFTVGNAPPVTPPVSPPVTPPVSPPVTPPPAVSYADLTGFWVDDLDPDIIYRIRHLGNRIYWSMDATAKGEYINVFHGEIKDNVINGEWLDLPGSPLRPALVAATMSLRIESNDRLVKVRSGNFYPAQVWTRRGMGPGSGSNSGVKCAEGKNERTINIDVPANRAWTGTGVKLNPCVQVMVEASGSIEAASATDPRGGFYHQVPPAGRGQFHSDKPYQTLATLSLIGRIGNGPVLPVGSFARWYAGPPYGNGELFLGINDDGLSDNSGAWKARITTFGAAETSGLTQKVLPSGIEKPKVEEIPDEVASTSKSPIRNKPDSGVVRDPIRPKVEEIPDDVTETPRTPAGRQPTGSTSGAVKTPARPKVEEIPDDVAQTPTTPARDTGDTKRPRPKVEEIPDDEPATPKRPTRTPPTDTTSAKVPITPKRQPTPTPNDPPVYPPVGQETGGVWSLESVTVTPANPPKEWNYSREGASAQFTIYNGDRASFQWSIPPQQFDSRGFTVSVAAQGIPIANSRVAVTIGVSGYGLTSDTPGDQQGAAVTAEGRSATAQKSVRFTPAAQASEIEVKIAFQWAITYIYKYRRVQ